MSYQQRDLVWLTDLLTLPDGKELDHPVLIISCQNANFEESYSAVMMTATPQKDRFSFPVENSMFEGALDKSNCQFRLHILPYVRKANIKKLANRMNKVHFQALLNQIKDMVLKPD